MFAVISLHSNLGLRPSGVELLPTELLRAGLQRRLKARHAADIHPLEEYDSERSTVTGLLNGPALRNSALALADGVAGVLREGDIPLVLAGDCSVILGALLGSKWANRSMVLSDRVGLLFLDGHVDFYRPDASPTGEVADMDLALAVGRGPSILAELDDSGPLVMEDSVVAIGARDADERDQVGSQDIRDTDVMLFELSTIRSHGIESIATEMHTALVQQDCHGFWCHIDADVLDDALMPAVDYRQPGGLAPSELVALLRRAVETDRMIGLSVAIYNPKLDPSSSCANLLVDTIVNGVSDWR
mgnify:FL=1